MCKYKKGDHAYPPEGYLFLFHLSTPFIVDDNVAQNPDSYMLHKFNLNYHANSLAPYNLMIF